MARFMFGGYGYRDGTLTLALRPDSPAARTALEGIEGVVVFTSSAPQSSGVRRVEPDRCEVVIAGVAEGPAAMARRELGHLAAEVEEHHADLEAVG
jgi:hypothetical protein